MNHAQQRAMERYSLALSHDDLDEIIAKIESEQALFLRKSTKDNATIWLVEHQGQRLPVVYSSEAPKIRTVLPTGDQRRFHKHSPRAFKELDTFDDLALDDGGEGAYCEIPHEHAVNTALAEQLAKIFGERA